MCNGKWIASGLVSLITVVAGCSSNSQFAAKTEQPAQSDTASQANATVGSSSDPSVTQPKKPQGIPDPVTSATQPIVTPAAPSPVAASPAPAPTPAVPSVPSVPAAPSLPAVPSPMPAPAPTPAPAPAPIVTDHGPLAACPPQNAHILSLDFKSGWWSGDGGDFVNRIVNGLYLHCQGTVALEYHHLVKAKTPTVVGNDSSDITNSQLLSPATSISAGQPNFSDAFADPTWNSYTQIWLLSGSSTDGEDVPITDPFFAQVLTHILASKANLFVGVGFGSISHANVLAQQFGLGLAFATRQPQGNVLNPMAGVNLISTISGAQLQSTSPLFSNGIQSLADEVNVAGVLAHGDDITKLTGFTVVATDNLNQNTLAVGTIAGRKVVFDADMPRYYAAWSNESDDTMQLLKNIVVYLAN